MGNHPGDESRLHSDNWNTSIVNGVLPPSLDGVSISMGGQPAYMYYPIAPGQLNVLAPNLGPGTVSVTPSGFTSTNPALSWRSD